MSKITLDLLGALALALLYGAFLALTGCANTFGTDSTPVHAAVQEGVYVPAGASFAVGSGGRQATRSAQSQAFWGR